MIDADAAFDHYFLHIALAQRHMQDSSESKAGSTGRRGDLITLRNPPERPEINAILTVIKNFRYILI
jgi:hypothetical protein